MKHKGSIVIFIIGIILILASPYIADNIMKTVFMHQVNFSSIFGSSIQKTIQTSGILLSLAGIIGNAVLTIKEKK